MDSGGEGMASVYSEAKGEYTKQLILFILPVFHRFFMGCLTQATAEEPNTKRLLWKFQEILSQIPEWNMDKVQRETQRLTGEIQCDYLEELLTAVFIAHTKVLTAIRIGNKNKRVQITIPKLDHFLHRALSECSRLLWSSAYLFHNDLSAIERQKNHRQIEGLLNDGIQQAIRSLLPVKNILKDYLAEDKEDRDDKDEEEEEKEEKEEKEKEKEEPHAEATIEKEETIPQLVPLETTVAPEPIEAPAPEPVTVPEPVPDSEPVEAPVPEPVVAPAPEPPVQEPVQPPTFVVDTEPSVRFTNIDQVIQETNGGTSINYVPSVNHEEEELAFLDDESDGALSDVEDLTDYPDEPLGAGDFEKL
jgi:outer membrane biosynthesis protein TonB